MLLRLRGLSWRTCLGCQHKGLLLGPGLKMWQKWDFFGLERRFIHGLRSDSGHVLFDHATIHKHAVIYYSDLYKCEHQEEQMLAQNFYSSLPHVKQNNNVVLEADISLDELHVALQSMQSRKTPGIDGRPVDFYKFFFCCCLFFNWRRSSGSAEG